MRRAVLLALLALLVVPASASAVVGGRAATQEYPHMAAFLYDRDGTGEYDFICGGSLVAPDKVLTAAHCVRDDRDGDREEETVPGSAVRFLLGTHLRSRPQDGETIQASSVEVHPRWTPSTLEFDVALVTLERASTETPIALATPSQRGLWAHARESTVTGWGTRFFPDLIGVSATDELQEVQVPIVSDADCQTSYNGVTGDFDPRTMVCAGEPYGTKDSCQGDSGGPLTVAATDGSLRQVGVVSWGFGCGYPTQYGVYSRVGADPLNNWIRSRLGTP